MKVFKGYSEIQEAFASPVLTIGNFDGLHLGHRQIIQSVVDRAKSKSGTSIVYTFRPHPHTALVPEKDLQLINTYDEKLDLLEAMGVDVVVEEPFSREFSTISPERFLNEVLVKRISPEAVYVGYDFGFGKERSGTLQMLEKFCKASSIELIVSNPTKVTIERDGIVTSEICSSSRIRNYIKIGDVISASKLLGREFFYRGLVVRGNGRGHKIGFATANVRTEGKLLVKEGVYATFARILTADKQEIFKSVTNVGRQPTFNSELGSPIVVETHLLDFNKDIYGNTLEIRMVARIRDEQKFSGIDPLVAQIKKDIASARSILL